MGVSLVYSVFYSVCLERGDKLVKRKNNMDSRFDPLDLCEVETSQILDRYRVDCEVSG